MFDHLIGIPYMRGGTDPKEGLNCYGLCKEAYKELGIEIPDFDHPSGRSLVHWMIIRGEEMCVPLEKPESFCFVVFALRRPEIVDHMGIVLQNKDDFIHVVKTKGCCIQRLSDPFYKARIQGFFKWKRNTNL